MRKRVTSAVPQSTETSDPEWLDLEQIAQVEVTSEAVAYPIESALVPGEQTIRLIFDRPQRLSRMWLLFIEADVTRTQEFVLRWSPDGGRSFREILRQQWNFERRGGAGVTREVATGWLIARRRRPPRSLPLPGQGRHAGPPHPALSPKGRGQRGSIRVGGCV